MLSMLFYTFFNIIFPACEKLSNALRFMNHKWERRRRSESVTGDQNGSYFFGPCLFLFFSDTERDTMDGS